MSEVIENQTEITNEMPYTAESVKTRVSGTTIRVDDVLNIKHGLDVQLVCKNLFNINIIGSLGSSSYVTNNGDGTLSVDCSKSRPVAISETLGMLAPSLKVGEIYTLSATSTDIYKYIYLHAAKTLWAFGKSLTITQEMLDSKVYFYAELGTIATVSDIQIEVGSTATPFEPYIKLDEVSVSRYGKNLFDISVVETSTGSGITNNQDGTLTTVGGTILHIPAGSPSLQTLCPGLKVGDVATLSAVSPSNAPQYFYLIGAKQIWKFGEEITITQEMLDGSIYIYNSKLKDGTYPSTTISNIQVELGSTATAYEPYKSPQTVTATASGKVSGLLSVSPTMTLISDNNIVTLECAYFPETVGDTVSTRLIIVADNQQKVHEAGHIAGRQAEHDRFWDIYQNYGKRTVYDNCFGGEGWTEETFKPKYDIYHKNSIAYMIFRRCGFINLEEVIKASGKKVTIESGILQYVFQYSQLLEVIGGIDFTVPITKVTGAFQYCNKLKKIQTLEISDIATQLEFTNIPLLEDVSFTGTIPVNISFAQSPNLTSDSVQSIIDHLKDLTGQPTQTLTVHQSVRNRMTSDQVSKIVDQKNWTLAPAQSTN